MKDGFENIDKVFKETFDGFEANVDPSVWTNVQSAIGTGGVTPQVDPVSSTVGTTAVKTVALKIAAAVITVGSIATAGYYVLKDPVEPTKKEVIAENIITDVVQDEVIEKVQPIVAEPKKEEQQSVQNAIVAKDDMNLEKSSAKNETTTSSAVAENTVSDQETEVTENITESNATVVEVVKGSETTTSQEIKEENTIKEEKVTPKVTEKQPEQNTPVVESKPEKKEAVVDLIPNVITPNGDGRNDVIKISGENLEKIELAIMDKTGKPVYRITSLEDEWSGKDQNGFDLLPGIYYMAGVVIDQDGNTKSIKQAINLLK